jgi:hypothetical protein
MESSMKNVVTVSEVPHLWAHQTQPNARTANGSLYFSGRVIYSYGPHFPIAIHAQNGRGETCVLFTTDSYSVTTQRHVSAVARSIPKGTRVFQVSLENIQVTTEFIDGCPAARVLLLLQERFIGAYATARADVASKRPGTKLHDYALAALALGVPDAA